MVIHPPPKSKIKEEDLSPNKLNYQYKKRFLQAYYPSNSLIVIFVNSFDYFS